jgi:hypothetical protein
MSTPRIENVYLLETEQPGDSFFSPSGIVVVGEKQRIILYCQNSAHNLYRAAVVRNSWEDLEKGVVYRDIGFRLRDVTEEMTRAGWTDMDAIPHVLGAMKSRYPRHLFFLKSHIESFS